jgi:hypothetical protein
MVLAQLVTNIVENVLDEPGLQTVLDGPHSEWRSTTLSARWVGQLVVEASVLSTHRPHLDTTECWRRLLQGTKATRCGGRGHLVAGLGLGHGLGSERLAGRGRGRGLEDALTSRNPLNSCHRRPGHKAHIRHDGRGARMPERCRVHHLRADDRDRRRIDALRLVLDVVVLLQPAGTGDKVGAVPHVGRAVAGGMEGCVWIALREDRELEVGDRRAVDVVARERLDGQRNEVVVGHQRRQRPQWWHLQ